MSTLFYFNADFDRELGDHELTTVRRAVDEMGVLFSPVANPGDRIILNVGVHDEYWNYLVSLGLSPPEVLSPGMRCEEAQGEPWGWSAGAERALIHGGSHCVHAPLDIVRYCNSRQACAEFAQGADSGVPGSTFCTTPDDAVNAICRLKDNFPLIIKPAFGGSGSGFLKLDRCSLSGPIFLKQLEKFCIHGGMVIEPWCSRTADISASCTISPSGAVSALRFHQCHVNSHGAFSGVYLAPLDEVVQRWRGEITEKAQEAVSFLYKKGYWGPAGFDSFVYLDKNGTGRCAPVIEINARHVMSDIAYALSERCAPGMVCCLRFVNKRRCSLPGRYQEWSSLAGNLEFDASRGSGVAVITPLRVSSPLGQPIRNAFFIAAKTREELFEMDARLRRIVEAKV